MNEKLQFLKNVYLFHDMDEKYIENFLSAMQMKEYSKGQEIIVEGEKGDSLFVLFKGKVSVTKKMTLFAEYQEMSRVDKALIRLKDTDHAFFGEMSLCGEAEERSATVTADSECVLGEITAEEISRLLKAHGDVGRKFYRNLAKVLADRLRKANRDVLKLTTALTLALEE